MNRLALAICFLLAPAAVAQDPEPKAAPDPNGYVELIVVDEDGEGIFKAMAYLVLTAEEAEQKRRESQTGSYTLESSYTDPDGFVTVSVPAGETRSIKVSKGREAAPATIEIEPLEPGEQREIEVALETRPNLDVTGRAVDEESGEPLPGIEVHISDRDGTYSSAARPLQADDSPDAITDAAGEFRVRLASWRAGQVTLVGKGRSPVVVALLNKGAVRPVASSIAMRKGASITGQLKSVLTALPPEATVVVEAKGYQLKPRTDSGFHGGDDVVFTAEVDKNGRYSFYGLPSESELNLRVVSGREVLLREPASRTFAAGSTTTVDLTLGLGRRVHGVAAEPDGTVAPHVEVWLKPARSGDRMFLRSYPEPAARARTDGEGRYEFEDVSPGEWTVGLSPRRSRPGTDRSEQYAPLGRKITIGEQDVEADLVVHRGFFIEGRIEGLNAELIPSNVLISASSKGKHVGNIRPQGDRFWAGPLTPGEWRITVNVFGSHGKARLVAAPEPVVVSTSEEPVVLSLREGCGLSLSGVDTTSGKVIPAVYTLYGRGGGENSNTMTPRDRMEYWNLPPGVYVVGLQTQDGRVGVLTRKIEAGELIEDLEVPMVTGSELRVGLEGPQTSGVVEVFHQEKLVAIGWANTYEPAVTIYAPPGDLTLRFTSFRGGEPHSAEPVSVTLGPDAVVPVTLHVVPR